MSVRFRKGIEKFPLYVPGKPIENVQKEYGIQNVIKLASNENPFGMSPLAIEALQKFVQEGPSLYPDGDCIALRNALSQHVGVAPEKILVTAGLEEMIACIARAFVDPGDETITADVTFQKYVLVALIMGGSCKCVPVKDFTFDLDGILAAITEKTKLIWICNPNNPTGTIVSEDALVAFLEKVPPHIAVVYDEAYREFAEDARYPKDSLALQARFPNVILMRTFSKIYGMAALRVGYAVAEEEIINNIKRVKEVFDVGSASQRAAIAALEDSAFVEKTYRNNREGCSYLYAELEKLSVKFVPTQANFILLLVPGQSAVLFEELQKRGIIVRPNGPDLIRLTIGTPEENRCFVTALQEILKTL